MSRAICLLDGHPSPAPDHFVHALADAYAAGAKGAGHALTRFNIADLDLPFLREPADFALPPPEAVRRIQDAVLVAEHLVVIYPLWLGTMPALVKAFFEHLARAEFAVGRNEAGWPRKMLKGRSARVVVTMGMPATAYSLMFGAAGVKGFESGILGVAGFHPIHETLIGAVDVSERERNKWLERLADLGRRGE
jgi:putative NADPH-quinone reductase